MTAGDEVEITVSLQPAPNMFRSPRATLNVWGRGWSVTAPVGATIIEHPEIDPIIPGELKIAPGGRGGDAGAAGPHPDQLDQPERPDANGDDQGAIAAGRGHDGPGERGGPQQCGVTWTRCCASTPTPARRARRDQLTQLLVDSGADRELFSLAGHVYPRETTWRYRESTSGDVSAQGELTIRADGTWRWKVNLHDSGTIAGDWFGTGAAIALFEYETDRWHCAGK